MKNSKKAILLFILSSLLCYFSQAQISVNFSPAVYGQTLEGLVYARIINAYPGGLMARVTIRVRENRSGNVVTVKTSSFPIHPGVNEINKAAFGNAKFTFGNNNFGLTLSQTGKFMEGEYEYCYEVDISDSKITSLPLLYENCFVHQLQPRTPLLLINPIDRDVFCNKHPQFIWQPPVPLPANARCRFVLTAAKEKQDLLEAVTFNPPLVNQANIVGNSLFYPVNAPELREGQRYVWQVIVYSAQTILSRSEVWTFTLQCKEERKDTISDSYRELKEVTDGNFYVANNYLRFSFVNPYAAGDLNYSIVGVSDPSSIVKGLPKLKMTTGINKYDLYLSENRSFKDGQEYLLKVQLPNNRNLTLRFIYKND
jgi:hypothetical protein